MKTKLLLSCMLLSSFLYASAIPVEENSPATIAIEYRGILSGSRITRADIPSLFKAHYLMLGYAPVPYLFFSMGIGVNKFSIIEYDSSRFEGQNGLSGAALISLFSPRFSKFIGLSGGTEIYYLNSHLDDFKYSGAIYNPFTGVILYLFDVAEFEAGIKGQIYNGNMKATSLEFESYFSNSHYFRAYFSLTLLSQTSGVYLSATIDASPFVSSDWTQGPDEASLKIQLGFLLRDQVVRKNDSAAEYFPGFHDMRQQQKNMAKELEE